MTQNHKINQDNKSIVYSAEKYRKSAEEKALLKKLKSEYKLTQKRLKNESEKCDVQLNP